MRAVCGGRGCVLERDNTFLWALDNVLCQCVPGMPQRSSSLQRFVSGRVERELDVAHAHGGGLRLARRRGGAAAARIGQVGLANERSHGDGLFLQPDG